MPSEKEPQIIHFTFSPNTTMHIQNPFKYPVNMTVRFGGTESVTALCIIGGEIAITCGDVAPTITFSDVIA